MTECGIEGPHEPHSYRGDLGYTIGPQPCFGNPCRCGKVREGGLSHGFAGSFSPLGRGTSYCMDCRHQYHGDEACGWPEECEVCRHTKHEGYPCMVCQMELCKVQTPIPPLWGTKETWCTEPWSSEEQRLVSEWHRKFGVVVASSPLPFVPGGLGELRRSLILEEAKEAAEAIYQNEVGRGTVAQVAKELADLLYVVYGTAVSLGIDMGPVFRATHESNMTKTPGNKREDGKVLKGPDYKPPDIKAVLAKQRREGE